MLVAGGAGGIGRAIIGEFLAAGATMTVADLAGSAPTQGAGFVACDVRSPAECAAAVAATVAATGRLDLLVNAAGLWVEGPSATMEEDDWDRVVDVNLKGAFFLIRHAIPHLVASRGQVINIASDAGLVGNTGAAIYSASKGGLVLLTKALALELAPAGVRVNAVCPCDVETPMLDFQAETYGGGDKQAYRERLKQAYPQGAATRFARPEEIAAFVFAIASPRLAPVTGAALSIDFGTTAGN